MVDHHRPARLHRAEKGLSEMSNLDAIEIEILWTNLIGIVTERARALQRTAFSPIVREAGDLACALFDRRGRMVAQAETGTPGHINTLARAGKSLAGMFAGTLVPGDVIVTNDPWLSAGHLFDITLLTPVFFGGALVGHFGSTIHYTDIGGYGLGTGARDAHEEGLWIPPLKLYEAGQPNRTLFRMIEANVRTPKAVLGDLSAQLAAGHSVAERLAELCRRHRLDDIEAVSDEIVRRSEDATRSAIRALRPATYRAESEFDTPDGETVTLKAAVTVDADAGEILVDFAGSSPQSAQAVNVVLNFAHAYTTFAIRSCLNPELPNNSGSLAPIKVRAPEGSIVNCTYPAPVTGRHLVGMYVPMPILKALHQVVPGRVLAEGSGAIWTVQIQGRHDSGESFTSSMFFFSGGMGARAEKPGPSATCYPTGVGAIPVETLEASMPIVFDYKRLRRGSGGRGRCNGGDGQSVQFRLLTEHPWTMSAMTTRLDRGPAGLDGGSPGAPGRFLVNGVSTRSAGKRLMNAGDVVQFETPGGGGYGAPFEG
jgi:N-methylhydantoinase B/oxoprolinase/acetone carboxylase alpha subunit